MRPSRRQYQIFIERSPQAVFQFLADPQNRARLCPPAEPQEVLSEKTVPLAVGAVIALRVKQGTVWHQVALELSDWNPPHSYTERQVIGPYATWVHRHRFEPFQSGTLMTEIIEYTVGGGPLGALSDRLWAGGRLDTYFHFRQQEAKRLLELVGRIKGKDTV